MRRIRAGDVELVGRQPFRVFEDPNHSDILIDCVAEHVCYDGCAVLAQRRELLRDKGAHSHILQADGIEHPRRRLAQAGRRGAGHRFEGEALYDDSAQAVQIHEVRKFDAVAEGAAGGQNGIGKAQCADVYGEVYRG